MAKKTAEPKEKSPFNKQWILDTGIPIIKSYNGNLTLRALHYRLVANGMTNDQNHYKKVVSVMTQARWDGEVEFDAFQDHERETLGNTRWERTDVESEVETAIDVIQRWATIYYKNRWENQPIYPEVWIEKKALQGVFQEPCERLGISLNPCKGYPSLTFLYQASLRFKEAIEAGKQPVILYFGDYDCSGEDIPRSIKQNLYDMVVDVEVKRIALMEHQVKEWKLPPAPTKETDSRGANWDGIGQVELDAVLPEKIVMLLKDAVAEIFDEELFEQLKQQELEERQEYKTRLKIEVNNILEEL